MKNFEILDKNFNSDLIHNEFLKDDSECSKLFRNGYGIECMWMPNPPNKRLVGGMESIELVLDNEVFSIKGGGECAHFIAIILGIEFCNHWEYIDKITLNNHDVVSIKIKEINKLKNIEIKIHYSDYEYAKYACSTLYYLISPYKDNDYYLEKELNRWSGGSD